jgi:hypothetical protein
MDPDRKQHFPSFEQAMTPLTFAVKVGAMEVVRTLLTNHAQVRLSRSAPDNPCNMQCASSESIE